MNEFDQAALDGHLESIEYIGESFSMGNAVFYGTGGIFTESREEETTGYGAEQNAKITVETSKLPSQLVGKKITRLKTGATYRISEVEAVGESLTELMLTQWTR